ncbi:MAG: hypothetical protein HN952_07295 [Candidatus Cloacimonetes bacterium]|jgi:Tol biopolymer transport system component|nr:hypothetical protein [Candidatus Cloacimonadota bacterium]MBT6994739.1 hypothetical protein [Candidatus Cloacimonadota bacterium]MBT7469473.1 hypothetical protein [Candidatus Cloacimonadota bacterium]
MKKLLIFIIIWLIFSSLFSIEFGKNKIQKEKIEWQKIETLHFDIYVPKGNNDFAKIVSLISEEAYFKIKNDLQKPLKNRVPIVFYQSHQNFETTNIISPILSEGVGGFTESMRNRVAIPFDGSYKKIEEIIIHELTHAFTNGIEKSTFLTNNNLPFWFAEGFPEFEAIEGKSVYNNMFVIDKLYNDVWQNLNKFGGYFAYRLGESFLVFIAEKYGRKKVSELFYALRYQANFSDAFEKIFQQNFEEIQAEWTHHLKQRYFVEFNQFEVPLEIFQQKTNHKKDGSFINDTPRISPDGNSYIYFTNRKLRTDIYKGSMLNLSENKKIIDGESSGKFEEFHFHKNNLSWFPNSKKFVFVAKTVNGDKIYVVDFQTGKIIEQFSFSDFDAIYEIDVSHDGEKIAFCGQKNFQTDIYILDLKYKKITQITNDKFCDKQPRWSQKDDKIAFASERTIFQNEKKIFGGLSFDIYYFDVAEEEFYQVTNDKKINNSHPMWFKNSIIFSTEREFTLNYDVINLADGNRAEITNSHGGIFGADISSNGKEMIFSVYFDGGWDIYQKSNPLENLKFREYSKPKKIEFKTDFKKIFAIDRYKKFGKRKRKFKNETQIYWRQNDDFNFVQIPEIDSSTVEFNRKLDEKPIDVKIPEISDYKTKFMFDYLWGGGAYLPSVGTYLQLQFGLSDLMGDHAIGVELGVTGDLEKSNISVQYLNLANRIDYGIGAFHLYDEWIYYYENTYDSNDYYFQRIRKKDYGIFGILRYPFNKFWRVDFQSIFYKSKLNYDFAAENDTEWQEDYWDAESEYFVSPQINLVHDNAIYSSTGPLDGSKFKITLNTNISQYQSPNSQIYADIRNYTLLGRRYSFATRFSGGKIWGDSLNIYQIDYYHDGVRGFNNLANEEVLIGQNKLLGSFELRFPFVDDLNIAFPLPLHFRQIRGSAFVDVGSVWNENNEFTENLKYGVGFGPRLNVGYFILNFNVAWQYQENVFGKPTYYFGLSEEF